MPAVFDDLAVVRQLVLDHPCEPAVASEPDDVLDVRLLLAPVQQWVETEPRVRSDDEPGRRTLFADVSDDPCDLLERSGGAVLVRRAELRRQQELPAEDVQREEAIVPVVYP